MKKFLSAFLAVLMIVMMLVPVSVGADDTASFTVNASKSSINLGEEVTFTVYFSGAAGVSILTVVPTYDSDAFDFVSGNFVNIAGDFDGVVGAFMSMSPVAIPAEDVFQFTLRAKKITNAATVSASMTLQNISSSFEVTDIAFNVTGATVSVVCNHTFGDWEKNNAENHKHTCSACGEVAYEAHKWDEGTVTTKPTHLTEGEKTYTCTVCKETKIEKIDKTTDHAYGEWTDAKDGKNHVRVCECGDKQTEEHKWDAGTVTKQPSHMSTGIKTYTCTVCKATKTETLDKTTDHAYGEWTDTKDGKNHVRVCECGDKQTEEHKWDAGTVTKQPSHMSTGIKTYTCTVCKATKTETLDKTTDHAYGEWTDTKDGKNHVRVCECGDKQTEEHKWDNGTVTKQPSHMSTGTKTYTCTECKATKTETLDKTTDHAYGEWTDTKDGENHVRVCECGDKETEAHKWDNGTVTKQPSHMSTGTKTYTCTECKATKTETLDKTTDHAYGEWTDTKDGKNHVRVCECGDKQTEEHKWDAGTVTKQPSHMSTGTKTYTCTECKATKTEMLDKTTDHAYGEWEKVDENQHKHTCECGHSELENHKWNAGEVTKSPTCKDTGIKTYTCTECKATKTETLEKTDDHKYGDWAKENDTQHKHICSVCGKTESADHTWNAGEVTKAPTCKETGIKTYTCTACGATKTETLDKTTDHKWDNGKVTKEATCKETGEKLYTCTVCAKTRTDTIPTTTNHVWGAWEKNNETVHTHECSVCGKTENRAHTWDDGVTTVQPSAGKDGEMVYNCTACGEKKTVVISATHQCSYGSEYKYSDTFHWLECSICLGKKNTQAHTWDEGTVITSATHTTPGKVEYACTACDMTKTEVLPLIKEHTYSAWTAHNELIHSRACECGDIEYEAHNFGEWIVVTEATSDAEGLEKHTCADCGKTVERTIAKLPSVNKDEYQITFHNVYGADDSVYQMIVKTGKAVVFDIEMTREGYAFGGWYKDEACTVAYDISVAKNDTADIELYARWIENEKAITITVEGATPINTVGAVIEGERIQVPVVSLKEGEKVEWYADADFTIPFNFDADVDYVASMTLYAKIVKDEANETTGSSATETTETTNTTATTDTGSTDDTASPVVPIVIVIVVILAVGIVVVVVVIKKKKD